MKTNLMIISLPNSCRLSKVLAEKHDYVFCEIKELVIFELGDLEEIKLKSGVDYYRKEVKRIMKNTIEYHNAILFTDFDMFRHNIDLPELKNIYKVFLDFGNPYTKDELFKRKMNEKIAFAKNGCDEVIDCNNYSEDDIVHLLERILNEE